MSDTMELPVTNLGNISEVTSMSVLETNPPKPTGFLLSKREVESVFCHNIKWDLASPVDPPKCLLDGDEVDEKIASSPSHFSSVEDICLALDESQETPEIKDQTRELLTSQSPAADHVVVAESKESDELVLPAQMDSLSQDNNSDTSVTVDECDPCQSKSFILTKTNDVKQIKGWQEKFTLPPMTQKDDQSNIMEDLPPPLLAIETAATTIPLCTDIDKETEKQSLDSVVDKNTNVFSTTDENDQANHSASDSAPVISSSQADEEISITDFLPVEENQGKEEPILTNEIDIFISVEENEKELEKSSSPIVPLPMEIDDEVSRLIVHSENSVVVTTIPAEQDDQFLAFQMDTEADAEILSYQMNTEALSSQSNVEAGNKDNEEQPLPSPTNDSLLVPESVSPSPVNNFEKYPDLLELASSNGDDNSMSIPTEELNSGIGSSEEDTKKEKIEPVIVMQQKPDLKELTKRLAEVSHCYEKKSAEINYKACSTIEKLKEDSSTLMETYSDLKFENEELLNKMKELDPVMNAQQDSIVNMEAMVVSTPAALRCNTLYDQITTEDDVEPYRCGEEIAPEEYEEEYGDKVPNNHSLTPLEPSLCNKLCCQGGCICPSLTSDKETAKHCEHPECMLQSKCILPKEIASRPKVITSIIHPDDKFYQKNSSSSFEAHGPPPKRAIANKLRPRTVPVARKNAQKKAPAKSSAKSTGVARGVKRPLVVEPIVEDYKLKQKCFVKIIRLDMDDWLRRKVGCNDRKLVHMPYVRLSRLDPKLINNHSVYCMEHQSRACPCI